MFYVCAHMYFYILRSRSQTFWSRKHRGICLVISVIIHLLSSFIQWRTLVWLFLFLFSVFGRFCFCFGKAARFVSTLMCRFVRHACAHYWYVIRTCALVKHCRCLCVLSSLVDVLFFYEMPWTDSRQQRSLSELPADVHIFMAPVFSFFLLIFVLFVFQGWMGSSSAQTRWTPHAARPSPDSWWRATPA